MLSDLIVSELDNMNTRLPTISRLLASESIAVLKTGPLISEELHRHCAGPVSQAAVESGWPGQKQEIGRPGMTLFMMLAKMPAGHVNRFWNRSMKTCQPD
jgi:hypothetical protein